MIDLHLHTRHSDGLDSVEELLKNAEEKKISIISITDHDSIGGYLEMRENKELRKLYSGKIIIGSELKASYKKTPIEILGYGLDIDKLRIHKVDQQKVQENTMKKYIEIMDKCGFVYDKNELYIDRNDPKRQWTSFAVASELLAHPENADKIKEIGEFTYTSFYRKHESNIDSIFYMDMSEYNLDINEIIARIHEAGGLAFLAHGWEYPFKNHIEAFEDIAKNTKIDGFECEYPLFSKEQTEKIKEICQKYNKYMSGGSDYHAGNKPDIKMGTGKNNNISVQEMLIKPWIDKVKMI